MTGSVGVREVGPLIVITARVAVYPVWGLCVQIRLRPLDPGGRDLGDEVLEVGPGPGRTTGRHSSR